MLIVLTVVQIIVAIVEGLLLLRLIFVFFNANVVGFVATVFSWTDPLLSPISSVFPGLGAFFLILVAMIIYAVISGILIAVFRSTS